MIEYIILGIIQGVLEWLPVSSQGMNTLAATAMGMDVAYAASIAIWLHIGTLCSAAVYFRRELVGIFTEKERKLLQILIVATVLTGLIGGPLYLLFSDIFLAAAGELIIAFIGVMLIVSGLLQRKAKPAHRDEKDIKLKDMVITGIVQGFAALPGISRSGTTTSSLLFLKFDSKSALRISFMMSIFAILAAEIGLGIVKGDEFVTDANALIGALFAFIFGLLTIGILMRVAERVKFWKFLIIMGVLCLFSLLFLGLF